MTEEKHTIVQAFVQAWCSDETPCSRLATLQARGDRLVELLDEVQRQGCEVCNGDCASANPPVGYCPTKARSDALAEWRKGC